MIPLVDLAAQHRSIADEVNGAVARVLESGRFVLGPEVAAFEEEFAAYSGAAHGVGVNSGTSALHLALLAAGVGPGDEVITVPFTFAATVAAIGYTGARAVLVDIDPETFTIDVARIEAAMTARTRAIVPVHLYGHPADMDPICDIARRRGAVVIEDAAQAHGGEYGGRRVGSLGDLACFSFYPSKNLGAYGEGGFVATGDPGYATSIAALRDWGKEGDRHHARAGFNHRMDSVQAAILRVKLRHLDAWTRARRDRAVQYDALLDDSGVRTPPTAPHGRHVYHLYAVMARERDALREALAAAGVQTGVHYARPVHLEPAYSGLGYRAGDFPVSERAARETLSLPMYPELTAEQAAVVAEAVREHRGAPV